MESKKAQNSQNNIEGEAQFGGLMLLNFKTYYKL